MGPDLLSNDHAGTQHQDEPARHRRRPGGGDGAGRGWFRPRPHDGAASRTGRPGRQRDPDPAPTPAGVQVLRRAELIELAASASDALASGKALPGPVTAAAGQRFELVLPFGCSGPNESGSMRWSYDEAGGALRIAVDPISWEPAQWGLDGSTGYDVAEGFWVSRPWSSSEECPRNGSAVPPDTEAITLPGQTLAITQFFADGDNRNARFATAGPTSW